jgi:deoxyribodipyrimidine photo-lyase
MLEALSSLDQELQALGSKLFYFEGTDVQVLDKLHRSNEFDSVWFNMDVTPYAVARDKGISDWCDSKGLKCHSHEDYMLHGLDEIRTKTENVYQVFTPFKNTCLQGMVRKVQELPASDTAFVSHTLKLEDQLSKEQVDSYAPPHGKEVDISGGRPHALEVIERIDKNEYQNYEEERNDAYAQKTTRIAAYLKFGCISFREAFHASVNAYGKGSTLVSELYWREFYYQLAFHKPDLLKGQLGNGAVNQAQKARMVGIKWKPATGKFWTAWCEGKTGVPIVDAGMRQLNKTGYMHNRPRMVRCSNQDCGHVPYQKPSHQLGRWRAILCNTVD